MMSTTQKRNKNRPNNSGATRGGRQRSYNDNRNTVMTDGIFANERFTHIATSLIGCVVQLQVKNGGIYEGVLKTFSPKMDVVLEVAHKCEDMGNNNNGSVAYVPPRDRLLEIIIFNVSDILSICALNVDLDYAVKDSFTDSAISKSYNGQIAEKDLRELTPWEGGDGEDLGLEGDPANGWDPNEMFRTNAERFDVKSTYDETLKMYTTPLDKTDSNEYKEREEKATKLAHEIEKSDVYKNRIALENGEGDEEEKFSAVKRPNENNVQTGKYIHPNKRNQHQQHLHQQNRNLRGGGHIANHNHHNLPNRLGGPQMVPQSNVQQPPPRITSPPTQPTIPVHHPPPVPEEAKLNNIDKEDRRSEVSEPVKTSPVPENVASSPDKPDVILSPVSSKVDRRNSNQRGREVITEELKKFQSNFNLADGSKEKEDKETSKSQERTETVEKVEEPVVTRPERREEKLETETVIVDKDPDIETAKKSTLNPNAKVFNPKSFPPKQHQLPQNPTPPRPHTQSPIIQPMPAANIHFPYILPQTMSTMPQQQVSSAPPPIRQTKRAIVSIQGPRQDLTAAAAQAVTGPPLLASHHIQAPQYQVLQMAAPPMMPQPTGYQVGQVMPMPSATATGGPSRMVPPTSVAMVPTSHHGAVDHPNQSHSSGPIFMNPAPVPAHMHQQFSHPNPAHIGPPQNQHGGQMNPQANTHHPAPSPTIQQQGPSQSHTQGHPPSSGTPQPQPQYNIGIQGSHPSLQASPHNPASPQTMHTMHAPFHFTSHTAAHGNPGNQQFSMTQAHINPPSSGSTHNMVQSPHLSHGPPQIVMMPHPNQVPQGGPQQPQPHGHQFQQTNPMGPHMAGQHRQGPGQGPVLHQATVPGLQGNNPTNIQPPNISQFVHPVHSQGGPPVQSYPPNH